MIDRMLPAVNETGAPAWRAWALPGVIGLFFLLASLGPLVGFSGGGATGDGNLLRQINYIVVFIAAAVLAGVLAHPERLLVIPLGLTLTLAWCWLSLFWAIEPSIGLRRLIFTTIIVWTVFLVVRAVGFERTTAALRAALVVVLVAGYIAALLFPSVGVHLAANVLDPGLVGDWKGVVIEKNAAGAISATTALMFIFNAGRLRPVLRWLVVLASVFFLWKTGSKTSLGLLIVAVAAGGFYLIYDRRLRGLFLASLLIVGPLVVFMMEGRWGRVLAPFSDPYAFTGRVSIWQALIAYSKDHPFGSGFGSFWWIGPDTPIYQYGLGWVKRAPTGHSGYLDLLVQIGIPGLVMAVLVLMAWPLFQLLTSLRVRRDRGAMLIGCLVFVIGHNVTETSMLDRDAVVGVVLLFTVALIGLECRNPLQTSGSRLDGHAMTGRTRRRRSRPTAGPGSDVNAIPAPVERL